MFQVDPSMAGGEAMCPMCHGVIAIPADAFGPPVEDEPPPVESNEFDFKRGKRGGMFDGLDNDRDDGRGGDPSGDGDNRSPPAGRFAHLSHQSPSVDDAPDTSSLLAMACPHCASPFQVDGSLAGQQAMCPTCHGVVVIPDLGAADENSPPSSFQPPSLHSPSLQSPTSPHAPPHSPLPPSEVEPLLPPSTPLSPPISSPPSTSRPSTSPPPSQNAPPPRPAPANPLPPAFDAPPPSTLRPPQPATPLTMPLTTPLTSKSTPTTDVPLSARQPPAESASDAPGTAAAKSDVESLLPPKGDEERSPRITLPPKRVEASAGETSANKPLTSTPSAGKSSASEPLSRSARIDALLPESSDPDEDVVAERPIAVEEPPEEDFPPLVADVETEAPLTDADGQPIRRLSAAERAKLRRIRTILLFAVGMLVLILAALLLPRLGFVFDVGKTPR